jgi:predicted RNase H-like HicB family nuclease
MHAEEEIAVGVRQYAVVIEWSNIDRVYIATVPDLEVHTHGDTREEAAKNAGEVTELIVASNAEEGVATKPPCFSALTDLYPNGEHMLSPA